MRVSGRERGVFEEPRGDLHDGFRKQPSRRPVVLCDFDGTISVGDVGEMLIEHFLGSRWRELDDRYHAGEYGMVELYERSFSEIRASEKAFEGFVLSAKIESSFKELATACKKANISLAVVSDGFDFYIDRLLAREGLDHLAVYSNALFFENGEIKLFFPNRHESCADCANCKKRIVESYRGGCDVIYIGNGLSDCCAAKSANLVFAKDKLADHLRSAGFPFEEYNDLADVISILRAKGVLSRP